MKDTLKCDPSPPPSHQVVMLIASEQYRGKVFKIATLDRWAVVISGKALVDELRRLPEDVMSVQAGLNEASMYMHPTHQPFANMATAATARRAHDGP